VHPTNTTLKPSKKKKVFYHPFKDYVKKMTCKHIAVISTKHLHMQKHCEALVAL